MEIQEFVVGVFIRSIPCQKPGFSTSGGNRNCSSGQPSLRDAGLPMSLYFSPEFLRISGESNCPHFES
jgi:hypothetical protein